MALNTVLRKALSKKKEQRQSSMDEFATALQLAAGVVAALALVAIAISQYMPKDGERGIATKSDTAQTEPKHPTKAHHKGHHHSDLHEERDRR